jgi:ABC-type uncharacterized transport system involved in gliding motility auxiliary subunit
VLRGIVVPPGKHTIELVFSPASYRWGRLISSALLPLLALVIVVETWRERRRRRIPKPSGDGVGR